MEQPIFSTMLMMIISLIALAMMTILITKTPSQHDLDSAFADKLLAGSRRLARQSWIPCFDPHIGVHAFGLSLPWDHPAMSSCQSRPRCQRPPCCQPSSKITPGIQSVEPDNSLHILLQLVLLLHPELPVTIV